MHGRSLSVRGLLPATGLQVRFEPQSATQEALEKGFEYTAIWLARHCATRGGAAGFQMYATSGRAAAFVRRVLAGAGSGGNRGRRGGGRGGSREYELFEL